MRTLAILILAASASAAAEGERLNADLFARPVAPLDLDWRRPGPTPWLGFRQAQERYRANAVTIRFGKPTRSSPSKVEVQVGGLLQKLLFVAAVIVTFLL